MQQIVWKWEENMNTFYYGSVKRKHMHTYMQTICEYDLFFTLFKLKVC